MPKFELSSEGGAVGSGGGGGLFCRGIIVGFCLGGGGGVALGAYFWPVAGDLVIFDGIYFAVASSEVAGVVPHSCAC